MDDKTKDPAEAIALYRSQIIGILVQREMEHGDLARALAELSTQRFMAPRSHIKRTYSVPTLERWYYAFKSGGLGALLPKTRNDKGRARVLSPELRKLLVDIRFEHPSASVPLILATLTAGGRLEERSNLSCHGAASLCPRRPRSSLAASRGRERKDTSSLASRASKRPVARRCLSRAPAEDRG